MKSANVHTLDCAIATHVEQTLTHLSQPQTDRLHAAFEFAQAQCRRLITQHPDYFPMYTMGGKWKHASESWTDWCGGFLGGMMWLFHQRSGDTWWRNQAEHYSRLLEHRKLDGQVHDLGFIFLNTFRRWYEVSGDPATMDVVAEAGQTLARRFQPKGRYLASFLGPQSLFIDIMMNVPLLYVAADWIEQRQLRSHDATSDPSTIATELRRIADQHVITSQKYLVRPDGSTAHEAIFDPTSGQFLRESTQQGLRADSCWSRGLAWALYGFGTVYRHTRNRQFLNTARRCADWFIMHLPAARVPYWDFAVPHEPAPLWDSSAAAIAACGLLQLAEIGRDLQATAAESRAVADHHSPADPATPADFTRYRTVAYEILNALCQDEFLAISRPDWEGIVCHAVYHMHKKLGVDESVMWGDHFFVEALVRAMGR